MRKIILIFIFIILFSKPILITDEFKSNILFDSTIKIFYKIPEEHIDTKIYYHQTGEQLSPALATNFGLSTCLKYNLHLFKVSSNNGIIIYSTYPDNWEEANYYGSTIRDELEYILYLKGHKPDKVILNIYKSKDTSKGGISYKTTGKYYTW